MKQIAEKRLKVNKHTYGICLLSVLFVLALTVMLFPISADAADETTYTVTSQNNGHGSATGDGAYATGDSVSLTASANSGYQFMYWEVVAGDVTIADELDMTTTFIMPQSDVIITAIFDVNPTGYTYTVSNEKATITTYSGAGGNISIPYKLGGYRVTRIADLAFYEISTITGVTLPYTLETIGYRFITGCPLTSLMIDDNNQYFKCIDNVLFNKSGTELILCSDYRTGSYTIPQGVTSIRNHAFDSCQYLTDISIPDSVEIIGSYAFYDCSEISTLTLPDSVTSIGDHSFYNCLKIRQLKLSSALMSIGDYALYGCHIITRLEIPDSVKSIGDYAFGYCSPFELTIGSNVESIGSYAFINSYRISTVSIPASVKSIGDHAFYSCDDLTSVYFHGAKPSLGSYLFHDCDSSLKIYYNVSNASSWSSYSEYPTQAFCNLTLDPQNGSTPQGTTLYLESGNHIPSQEDPLPRIGYTFAGWYKEKGCENQWVFETDAVTGDMTLYAKWTEGTHTSFATEEGSYVDINDASSGVLLCFDNVTGSGETMIEMQASEPADANFNFIESCGYYNIETTAVFSGDVQIIISYDPSKLIGAESLLRLCQFKDGIPVDITWMLVDTEHNMISGIASDRLGTFAVGIPNNYTVSASVNEASFGIVSGGGEYQPGSTTTLRATPNTGYHFVCWTEGGRTVSENAHYSFAVRSDRTLRAEFAINSYDVNVSANNTSYGSVSGGGTFNHGTSVTLTATPASGYRFVSWREYGVEVSTNVTYSFFVKWDTSLVAVFESEPTPGPTPAPTPMPTPAPAPTPHVGTFPANKIPAKANAGTAITAALPAAPRGYTVVSVNYSSSNPGIATVDTYGNVTFIAGGKVTITTTITSQMTDNKGKVKTKTTVVRKTITVQQPVASISLNMPDTTIARTQKVTLVPSFNPATASNKKVKWVSSNPKVAVVSGSGVVTGKTGGSAVITCTAKDGSGVSASCTVTVTPIYPASIKLSKSALTLKTGKTSSLKAAVAPKNTDYKTVTWSSSNPAVVSVDTKGKIRALSSGTTVITATTSNGIIGSCTVTVP